MIKQNQFPPIILAVIGCSLIYWIYLAYFTKMEIVFDAIGYEQLGRILQKYEFIQFFQTGPQREPFYPYLISLSMHLETLFKTPYTKIMAGLGVVLLSLTQLFTYFILKFLNVRTAICVFILIYLAISPSLNNSAFSLFSEIATYPFILGIVLITFYAIKCIQNNDLRSSWIIGFTLGSLLIIITLTKAVFEFITPIYLISFLVFILLQNPKPKLSPLIILFLCTIVFYYGSITGYKLLNKKYNGHFEITNRGPLSLYGVTARRVQPMTPKDFLIAASYVPGDGFCRQFFSQEKCDYWSLAQSDQLAFNTIGQLNAQYPSQPAKVNQLMIDLAIESIKQNPVHYSIHYLLESFKMAFWESTKIGFVEYPHWLQRLYDHSLFKSILRLLIAFLTSLTFLHCLYCLSLRPTQPLGLVLVLILLFTLAHSFFIILPRYIFPIVPLYLICMGYSLQTLFPAKEK